MPTKPAQSFQGHAIGGIGRLMTHRVYKAQTTSDKLPSDRPEMSCAGGLSQSFWLENSQKLAFLGQGYEWG